MKLWPKIKPFLFSLTVTFALFSGVAQASASGDQEVDHLLAYVADSGCVFIRNGEEHPAVTAREHMENKYAYAKFWIDDGDDFIKGIASESSTTGEQYKIRCNGVTQFSGDWLKTELARYRSQH